MSDVGAVQQLSLIHISIVSGNIIAATAVLLIHMERNVVAVKRYVIESFKFPLAKRIM